MGRTQLTPLATQKPVDPTRPSLLERGSTKLGILFTVLCVAVVVFLGWQVFPFYYYFYEIQGLMDEQARKGTVFTDVEIRQTLMQKIKKLQLPISSPEDLKINRFNGEIVIELNYSEVLYFQWKDYSRDLHVFKFEAIAKAPLEAEKKK